MVKDPATAVKRDGESIYAPKRAASGVLEIRKAVYGVFDDDLPGIADVTEPVARLVREGRAVRADNSLAGDPAPNQIKEIRVFYVVGGRQAEANAPENQVVTLPKDESIQILKAWYGILPTDFKKEQHARTVDVTEKLAALVKDGRIGVFANNTLAGDPAPLTPKQLRVEYLLDGVSKVKIINENEFLELPDSDWWGDPVADVCLDVQGHYRFRAWQPGSYEIVRASGVTQRVDAREVPEVLAIEGPWEVRFQSKAKTPSDTVFDKLISWTQHADPDIRYFSGTATYVKEFAVPESVVSRNLSVMLDLGRLANLAQVRLNGEDLGILWKPPYRVVLPKPLKPGLNRIEIAITNLWPNRLIGDEQLPDDCEWNNTNLKKWPEWFMAGQPRPSAARTTFTTWKHYTKDAPLLDSGLYGPVRLYSAETLSVGGE